MSAEAECPTTNATEASTPEFTELEMANCPFCGGEGTMLEDSGYNGKGFVRCWTCWSAGPESDSKREAIVAWNRRAEGRTS